MFWKIFTFELKYRFRRPATYLYFFLLAAFIALVTANGGVGGVSEKVYMNSPQLLGNLFLIMSVFGLLIASAIMGVPVYRDIDHETRHYFFSFPMKERDYLLGRYLGSFVTLIFVASSLIFGVLIGGSLAQIFNLENADKVGPWNLYYLIYPFVFYVIPNMLFAGSIFFSLVALTRKISTTYTASVLLFIGYLLSGTFTSDLEYRDLVDILDPFALQTFNNATKYFSVVEQNTQFPPMAGNLLINRILWTVVGLAIFGISLLRFRFQDMLFAGKGGKKKAKKRRSKKNEEEANIPVSIPLANLNFNFATRFRQMLRLAGLEFRLVTRDVYFIAILLGGLIFLFLDGWFGSPLYGTPFKPVTYSMLEVHDFTYVIFVYIILIFYTGEVMHRDKSRKFDGIADALPVPNWVLYGSKLIGMILVGFVLVNMPIITGVLNQALSAYFNFELGLYLQDLYLIKFPEYLQLIALAFLVHILVNRKFMGHILTIGIWLGMGMIRGFLEYNYNLWFYSYAPGYTYSDMNGFGHFVEPLFWFNLYWLLAAVIFIVIGVFFWRRGVSDGFKDRIKKASFRFKAAPIIAGVTALVLFIGVGRFIYYNVSVLNTFRTSEESRDITVE